MKQYRIILTALLLVTGSAFGQLGQPNPVISLLALTNLTDAGVSTGNVARVSVSGWNNVAVQLVVSNTAATTSNTVLWIEKSIDGNNWVNYSTMFVANAGTVTKSVISNYVIVGDAKWRLNLTNGYAPALSTNYISIIINQDQD